MNSGCNSINTETDTGKAWFIYIIRAQDNSLYTGITTDPQRRFKEHLSNSTKSAKYLRAKKVKEMVYIEKVNSRQLAAKREYAIKQLTKIKKEALVDAFKDSCNALPKPNTHGC